MSLKYRLAIRVVVALPLVGALLFGPAGSFDFWQGWVFAGMFVAFTALFVAYFYSRDPKLVERRLQNREPRPEQKRFQRAWATLWICTLCIPGLDYRFGWSRELLGGVPLWLTVASMVALFTAWLLVFEVLRWNRFASTVVKVEAGQKLITNGPYRVVRHPMYTGFALMVLATPFALGSYAALLTALPILPVLVYRLRDEESVLHKELPGYTEYCERTRNRLIPNLY